MDVFLIHCSNLFRKYCLKYHVAHGTERITSINRKTTALNYKVMMKPDLLEDLMILNTDHGI